MRMIIQGGHRLTGRVPIFGSKNAIGPLIASSIIIKGPVRLKNVPHILDVVRLLEILQKMGAVVSWINPHELEIDTRDIDPVKVDKKTMKQIRFSILLLGPMLARFKKMIVPEPGGDIIGKRPIDTHLFALKALGASVESDDDRGGLHLEAKKLVGGYIVLPEFSVTATENLIMAAVVAHGHTSIRLAAAEPHVQELCRFLNAAGAKIKGIGTHDLEITGVVALHAPKKAWKVIPDTIEIGTFAVAAAVTHGTIEMSPVIPEHLDALRFVLTSIGVKQELDGTCFRVQGGGRMNAFKLQTMIYPGFPTDLQAPFGLLATQCHGVSLIHDPLFEARLGYLHELIKMGANAIIADPHRAVISGPTSLRGTEIRSLDIRAGVTMVLAGLAAQGETIIHDAEMVDRGYEDLDGRLRSLGAEIVCLEKNE
ncbi:MAG: UDP-N-acetylglucosamine 1-carboxyvinyltransferase [Candidatus Uhrbacteria bacterium]|nr:UDP-N-acetylglucosamine 1-carboxyvinyltransferase [Candidatus Uhrbacteria bacterium]